MSAIVIVIVRQCNCSYTNCTQGSLSISGRTFGSMLTRARLPNVYGGKNIWNLLIL